MNDSSHHGFDAQTVRVTAGSALAIDADDVALIRIRSGWRAWDRRTERRMGVMHALIGDDARVFYCTADFTDEEAEATLQEGS